MSASVSPRSAASGLYHADPRRRRVQGSGFANLYYGPQNPGHAQTNVRHPRSKGLDQHYMLAAAKPANGVRERGVVDRVLQIVDRGLGDRQAHIDLEYLGGSTFVRMDPDMGIDL